MDMQLQAEVLSGLSNRGHFLQSRGGNAGSKRVSESGCFMETGSYSVIYLSNN